MPKLPMSQEQYRIIFECSPVAIMVVDANQRIVFANSFTERLLGLDEASLLSIDVSGLFSPEGWERICALMVYANGPQEYFDTKMKHKNGSFIDVEISLILVKDDHGSMAEFIVIAQDIGPQKAAENEVLAAARSKGEFLAMVSHELRTPLTAIKGSLGIMIEGATGELNEEQKDFLVTAQRNAERLEMLINNVLDYQRLEAGMYEFKLVSGDVNQVVELVVTDMELLAQKKNLKLVLAKADQLPTVMIDGERLKRAIRNLVDNAIKFTSNGEISIITSFEFGQVVIHVKDTGIGIKPEEKEKLFERFFQASSGHGRHTGSLGLGLAIARRIVSAHNGDIWVQSTPGQGSTFSICLPLKEQG